MYSMTRGDEHDQDSHEINRLRGHLRTAGRILSIDDSEGWPEMLCQSLTTPMDGHPASFEMATVIRFGSTPTPRHASGTAADADEIAELAMEVFDSIDDDPIIPGADASFAAGRIDAEHVLVIRAASAMQPFAADRLREALLVFIPAILAVDRGHRLVATSRSLENHRVLERRIAETLSAVGNIRELGQAVNTLAAQLFSIEFTGIYFRDPASHNLRLVGAHGLAADEIAEAERTAWERHPGHVIQKGESIMVADTREDTNQKSVTSPQRRVEIRSRCYLPVNSGGEIVGTLGLASSRPGAFGESHVEGLEFLADLAGLTWSRLLEQGRRETRDQILIAAGDAAERLLRVRNWKDALPGMLDLVRRAFKAESAWFIEANGEGTSMNSTARFPLDFVRAVVARDQSGATGDGSRPAVGFDLIDSKLAHPWAAVPVPTAHTDAGILVVVDESDGRVHDGHSVAALRAFAEPLAAKIARDELEERLARTDRMELLGQMAGGVAHDINNLLTPVLGLASALTIDEPDPDRRRKLGDIQLAAERGRDFVEQVLLLTRRRVATDERTNLAEVVAEAITLLKPSTPDTIRLEACIDDDRLGVIGDRTAVLRLVQNLVTNARHAINEDRGTVTIGLRQGDTPDEVFLEVLDDGSGMPEEVRSRLFDPFFTTRRSNNERGLGLTIVHRIVSELGGQITVKSSPGAGSSFLVALPAISMSEVRQTPPRPEDHLDSQTASGRILVVDDDEMVRSTTEALIESLGYDVDTADCGEVAIQLSSSTSYDLILTDLSMPGMDGLELIEHLRSTGFVGAAAVFTGYGEEAIATASKSGVDEVIRKPISRADLGMTIQNLLVQSRS